MNLSPLHLIQTLNDIRLAAKADWGSLHPLVVHFPIVLLLIVPVFILAGLLFQKSRKQFFGTALFLLWLGVVALFFTFSTGEAASELVAKGGESFKTLKIHYNLAEMSRNLFAALTGVFTVYFLFCAYLEKALKPCLHNLVIILYIVAYSYALLILANTAHEGGRLVHRFGIHSNLYNLKR